MAAEVAGHHLHVRECRVAEHGQVPAREHFGRRIVRGVRVHRDEQPSRLQRSREPGHHRCVVGVVAEQLEIADRYRHVLTAEADLRGVVAVVSAHELVSDSLEGRPVGRHVSVAEHEPAGRNHRAQRAVDRLAVQGLDHVEVSA